MSSITGHRWVTSVSHLCLALSLAMEPSAAAQRGKAQSPFVNCLFFQCPAPAGPLAPAPAWLTRACLSLWGAPAVSLCPWKSQAANRSLESDKQTYSQPAFYLVCDRAGGKWLGLTIWCIYMDIEEGATSPGFCTELQLPESARLGWPGSLVNELNQWAHPSVSLMSRKGPYTEPEQLEPALPQAVPPPGINSKEKREGSNTDSKNKKNLQTSLQTLHKYQEWQRRLLHFQQISLGPTLVHMKKKRKRWVIQFC